MSRVKNENEAGFGSDSFMDVVCNVVGILIILVMFVGIRVKRAPVDVPTDESSDGAAGETALLGDQVHDLEEEAARIRAQLAALNADMAARLADHAHLNQLIADQREALEERKMAESADEQRQTELQKEHAVASAYLDRLEAELAESKKSEKKPNLIESYPTPISRLIEANEAHFQLRAGRIAYVPIDDLLAKLRSSAVNQIWKLKEQTQATDTIGPIGGFRMKFTMERVEIAADRTGRGGTYAQLAEWTLIPTQNQLGETVEQALAEGSLFRKSLRAFDPRIASVTVWTYPDSFPEFRQLKKELYRLGYATAGRPLPDGHPIGGSPHGSKSAAQ